MKKFLLVPVFGFFGLGAVSVGYAAVGVLLAVLLLAILTLPLIVAFKRFAPHRYARMQESRPIW
jgi:membrane protein implicated in regulation of membrane protease activity